MVDINNFINAARRSVSVTQCSLVRQDSTVSLRKRTLRAHISTTYLVFSIGTAVSSICASPLIHNTMQPLRCQVPHCQTGGMHSALRHRGRSSTAEHPGVPWQLLPSWCGGLLDLVAHVQIRTAASDDDARILRRRSGKHHVYC